jgi:hypothetical protein
MENRFVERGSALAVLLAVLALLGSLAALLAVHVSALRQETEDVLLNGRLATAARDTLEHVTSWVQIHRPDGPLGNCEPVMLSPGDAPSRLDLFLPEALRSHTIEGAVISARLQWCVFDAENIRISEAPEFPPSLLSETDSAGFFRQSFPSAAAETGQNQRGTMGAWRITVNARFLHDEGDNAKQMRRVCFERVLVLEK